MMEKRKDPDLIEKIAYSLPLDVRAEFLNEMRYLRSLSENDEMLRILRAMMFLTLLTEQVPQQILTEREKLEYSCKEITATAKSIEKSGSEYYRQLNKQLTQLPADIAAGINPKAIVENINDSLKKQFDISTIPLVAQELAAGARTIKAATSEYTRSTIEMSDKWRSASAKAHEAIDNIRTTVSNAVETSEKATKSFTRTFNKTYRWVIGIIAAGVLLTGIMIGILIFDYFRPRTKNIYEIPYELILLLESRHREREQTLAPQQETKPQQEAKPVPKPKQEAKPAPQEESMRLPPVLIPLQDLNIWKLVK